MNQYQPTRHMIHFLSICCLIVATLFHVGCATDHTTENECTYIVANLENDKKLPWFAIDTDDESRFRVGDVYFSYVWVGDQFKPASYPSAYCICVAWNSITEETACGYVPLPPDSTNLLYPGGLIGEVVDSQIKRDDASRLTVNFEQIDDVWVSSIQLIMGKRMVFVSGNSQLNPEITPEQAERRFSKNLFQQEGWRVGYYYNYLDEDQFLLDQLILFTDLDDWQGDGSPESYMLKNGGIDFLWREDGLARRLQKAVSE